MPNKRTILSTIAKSSPIFVALFCSPTGNLLEVIEIKMILSTPSTISRNVSVKRLNHTVVLAKSGMEIKLNNILYWI